MKLEEFNAKVAELKAEGAKLAQAGKLEEAEAKKAETKTAAKKPATKTTAKKTTK